MIMGHQISQALLDALNLPPMVRGFTLRCYSGEAVTVECEYYPTGAFQTELARYHLVPTQQAPAAPIHFDAWLSQHTERAHREFMERTSRRLPCDSPVKRIPKDIARHIGAVRLSLE